MPKFRKKPVVIEAFQIPPVGVSDLVSLPPMWLVMAIADGVVKMRSSGGALIETLEGDMLADVGDWIIKGVKNELYPCKPDIFEATYDAVEG